MLPLKICMSEGLKEFAPSAGNVLAQVWKVQFLVKQACWSFEWRSPCQGRDFRGTDSVLPGFDPCFSSLNEPGLSLFQEGFESFNVCHSPKGYQGEVFLQLVSDPRDIG